MLIKRRHGSRAASGPIHCSEHQTRSGSYLSYSPSSPRARIACYCPLFFSSFLNSLFQALFFLFGRATDAPVPLSLMGVPCPVLCLDVSRTTHNPCDSVPRERAECMYYQCCSLPAGNDNSARTHPFVRWHPCTHLPNLPWSRASVVRWRP